MIHYLCEHFTILDSFRRFSSC